MSARYIVGDVFDVLATLPDASVDLVMTSPPFLALRSYLPADHPDKAKEIGSEPTPAEFLDTLLALTAEWGRVLAPHGSICVELGDTYSSPGGTTDNRETSLGGNDFAERRRGGGDGWPLDKSLCGIPTLYAWSLAYGRNLLTGEESPAGQWRIRNVIAWCRPNPPVGALGDKFRPATSYMTVATRARDRWFDLDAVRTPHKEPPPSEATAISRRRALNRNAPGNHTEGAETGIAGNPAGAPPLDYWVIPTHPYKGSHYATFPPALCEKPIQAMCPREVCETCGQPRRRMTAMTADYALSREEIKSQPDPGKDMQKGLGYDKRGTSNRVSAEYETLGWSDCGHGNYRPGVVLDPFAGSGTTLAVATGHGRDCIGIDLDSRNADLAAERVGMFLTVETLEVSP